LLCVYNVSYIPNCPDTLNPNIDSITADASNFSKQHGGLNTAQLKTFPQAPIRKEDVLTVSYWVKFSSPHQPLTVTYYFCSCHNGQV